jgi:hypothetical protein
MMAQDTVGQWWGLLLLGRQGLRPSWLGARWPRETTLLYRAVEDRDPVVLSTLAYFGKRSPVRACAMAALRTILADGEGGEQ